MKQFSLSAFIVHDVITYFPGRSKLLLTLRHCINITGIQIHSKFILNI